MLLELLKRAAEQGEIPREKATDQVALALTQEQNASFRLI